MLTTAAAHDPGWRRAFAATANSLAQSGQVPIIAGDYSGAIPWIASASQDGSVLGQVFVALGMDLQVPAPHEPTAGGPADGVQTGLASGSALGAADSAEPVPRAAQPVSGVSSEAATAPIVTSGSPYQPAAGYSHGPAAGGDSPHTVSPSPSPFAPSPFSVPPADPPRRSRAPLLIGIVVLVLVVLVGGGGALAFFLLRDDGEPRAQPTSEPATPTPSPSEAGLVGRWDMDEGSGSTADDSSGVGNDASFVDGVDWTGDGFGGTPAVEFGDSPGHLATDGPVVLSNRSFTVSAWVRLSQETPHNQYVLWQSGTDASAFVLQYLADGLWGFSVTSVEGGSVSWHELSSTSSPVLAEWTHVAGVYDREQAEIRIYVNGRFEAGMEATAQPSVSGLLIGSGGTGRLYGTVDGVRAYEVALTDEEMATLYEEQQGGA